MRKFELYVDESGKFVNEENAITPSLIGGILVKSGELNIQKAQNLMKEILSNADGDYVHITDIAEKDKKLSARLQVEVIKKIKEIPAYLVIFQNNELLEFNDDKRLYLNIMAEGISNLLEKLSMEKTDPVELEVIAAVRRDLSAEDESTIIELEEYSKKIKEKIYTKMAEKELFLSKHCKVNFKLSSARKNPKLMISDVVCNSMLTKKSSKFTEEQKKFLDETFSNSKYVFNVYRTDIQRKLSNYLIQNNITDAIFLLNDIDEEKTKKEVTRLIINNINSMHITNLKIQIELLSLKIKSLIDVQRNLLLCENLLLNIQDNILSKITVKDHIINKLKLDVSLYLLTIYTHLGSNLKCQKQIEISKNELAQISGSWDFLDYYYILKTREGIYYNTCFNNQKTIEIMSIAIEKIKLVLNSMEQIEEFEAIKSDIIAKCLGTRLQSYIASINPNISQELRDEYYFKAKQDSDSAIKQFVSQGDKSRQYQYRCMLEIAVGNTNEAIQYLMKIVKLEGKNFDKFLDEVAKISDFSINFIIYNYFEIMQVLKNSKNKDDIEIGIAMFNAYKANNLIYEEYSLEDIENTSLINNSQKKFSTHPFEMIYWDLGKYFKRERKDLAIKYFNKAIEICNEMGESTIRGIELAIEADKLYLSNDINNDKKVIIEKYKRIFDIPECEELNKFLVNLKDEFESIELFDDEATIKEACKIIATSIRV